MGEERDWRGALRMKRLYMTVEGQTEAAFVEDVLIEHLAGFRVNVWRPRFTGPSPRRRGHIPSGGMFNRFVHAIEDIRRWLKEDQSPDARFSMMVDLYELPSDFPGYEEASLQNDCYRRAEILEKAIFDQLGDNRFIPYLQVHEFEALVLTDARQLADLYQVRGGQLDRLVADCAMFPSPERINLGRQSHPKYRIKTVVQDYDENVAGPLVASAIGLATLRLQCPHFGEWLTRLEQMDSAAA